MAVYTLKLTVSFKDLPIIALTAHLDVDKKQECLDAGMTDFINKPVAPEELCEVLGRFFLVSGSSQKAT